MPAHIFLMAAAKAILSASSTLHAMVAAVGGPELSVMNSLAVVAISASSPTLLAMVASIGGFELSVMDSLAVVAVSAGSVAFL